MNDSEVTIQSLMNEVARSFEVFGRTPLQERLSDIQREAMELGRYVDVRNLREEAGDLLCSLLQLFNESGWSVTDVTGNTFEKIERRKTQYHSLGSTISFFRQKV